MLEIQIDYIMKQIKRLEREKLAYIDLKPETEKQYNDSMQQEIKAVDVWAAACGNYYSASSGRNVTQWPHTIDEFASRMVRPDEQVYEAKRG
jgi:hypothetical protein